MAKSTKSVSKRDGSFQACPLFFRLFSTLGPNGAPGLPQGGPGRHFDPILVTFSLFFAYFFTALPQAKETKSYTPAAKKASIPSCFQGANLKTSDGPRQGLPKKRAAFRPVFSVHQRRLQMASPRALPPTKRLTASTHPEYNGPVAE